MLVLDGAGLARDPACCHPVRVKTGLWEVVGTALVSGSELGEYQSRDKTRLSETPNVPCLSGAAGGDGVSSPAGCKRLVKLKRQKVEKAIGLGRALKGASLAWFINPFVFMGEGRQRWGQRRSWRHSTAVLAEAVTGCAVTNPLPVPRGGRGRTARGPWSLHRRCSGFWGIFKGCKNAGDLFCARRPCDAFHWDFGR